MVSDRLRNVSLGRDELEFKKLHNQSPQNRFIIKPLEQCSLQARLAIEIPALNLFSENDRREILARAQEGNASVAKIYVGDSGGKLFDPLGSSFRRPRRETTRTEP